MGCATPLAVLSGHALRSPRAGARDLSVVGQNLSRLAGVDAAVEVVVLVATGRVQGLPFALAMNPLSGDRVRYLAGQKLCVMTTAPAGGPRWARSRILPQPLLRSGAGPPPAPTPSTGTSYSAASRRGAAKLHAVPRQTSRVLEARSQQSRSRSAATPDGQAIQTPMFPSLDLGSLRCRSQIEPARDFFQGEEAVIRCDQATHGQIGIERWAPVGMLLKKPRDLL